jgi:hypothetical protein
VQSLGAAIIDRYEGVFERDRYVDDLVSELKKYDLNDSRFRNDIARSFVRLDIAQRANVDPFIENGNGKIDPALFRRSRFRRGVIRLGCVNGKAINVKMIEATGQQWITRQLHQQIAASAAQRHAQKTTEFLHTEPGVILLENPRLITDAAMAQLELPIWSCSDDDDEMADNDE